jgi:hypothetical protein
VRLDRQEPNGEQSFANLAIIGDILGAETLLFGRYTFTATALSACVISHHGRKVSTAPAGDSLLGRWRKPNDVPPRSSPCAADRRPTASAAW